MNSETVFKKAAVKLGMKYLGQAREGRYTFGHFESNNGDIFKSFYFPAIKDVVWAINEKMSKAIKVSDCK